MPAHRHRRTLRVGLAALAAAGLLVSLAVSTPASAADTATAAAEKPDAATTGSRIDRDQLIPHQGDLIVTQAGSVVSGRLVTGRIIIRAANVTVRDNIVEAGVKATGSTHLIDTSNAAAKNATIEHNTVSSSRHPNIYINGIGPKSYTATANEVFDVVDGFTAADTSVGVSPGDAVTIRGNYVHDLFYITPASTHSDNRTHNDGVQIHGGPGTVTIEGNTIDAIDSKLSTNGGGTPSLASIMLNTNPSRYASDVVIRGNWLNGGAYSVNGMGTGGGRVWIESNVFGPTRLYNPVALNITKPTTWVIATSGATANTYEVGGAVVGKTGTFTSGSDTIRRYY
jgi:hypothetical protein